MRFIGRAGAIFAAAALLGVSTATAAELGPIYTAPDGKRYWSPVIHRAPPIPQWAFEFGTRYWASWGRTQLDLYAAPPGSTAPLISRLTYKDLTAHSGELYGRLDHITGVFVKGFAGGGIIPTGSLRDEDFPPFIDPYSSTNSKLRDGKLAYGTLDVGWSFSTGRQSRAGFFAGYHHYFESLHAFGCVQSTASPICVPSIPDSLGAISQKTQWGAVRLGLNTEWWFAERWKFGTDVAWVPFVFLRGSDTHHLRTDLSGSTPEKGAALGNWQIEATLSYAVTQAFSLGVGARYWVFDTGPGGATVHFEQSAANGGTQAASFLTERFGAFAQANYRF